ncbi:basic proline-rich protein-like [Lynx canadensis]|uniref:basic proline-rich protein-like n=1 Tax=Lynx canadensis TaxID=61383 RepID=UPI0011B05CBA|nr:basic proline-rich protein-like [Lynx canadensis]
MTLLKRPEEEPGPTAVRPLLHPGGTTSCPEPPSLVCNRSYQAEQEGPPSSRRSTARNKNPKGSPLEDTADRLWPPPAPRPTNPKVSSAGSHPGWAPGPRRRPPSPRLGTPLPPPLRPPTQHLRGDPRTLAPQHPKSRPNRPGPLPPPSQLRTDPPNLAAGGRDWVGGLGPLGAHSEHGDRGATHPLSRKSSVPETALEEAHPGPPAPPPHPRPTPAWPTCPRAARSAPLQMGPPPGAGPEAGEPRPLGDPHPRLFGGSWPRSRHPGRQGAGPQPHRLPVGPGPPHLPRLLAPPETHPRAPESNPEIHLRPQENRYQSSRAAADASPPRTESLEEASASFQSQVTDESSILKHLRRTWDKVRNLRGLSENPCFRPQRSRELLA